MKISTMRLMDKWLGVIVCFLLTVVRKLSDIFRSRSTGPVKSILFVKLAEQGATVLAYPAIKKAVENLGRENVYFLVFEDNRFILDTLDLIPDENVIIISTSDIFSVIRSALKAIIHLRREKIDSAVDFEFFARSSACLCYLTGAKRRVGFHSFAGEASYRGDLMTHRLSFNSHLHATQIFMMMVEAVDISGDDLPAFDIKPAPVKFDLPRFAPAEEEIQKVKSIISQETKVADFKSLILLNANCSDLLPLRRWPSERYVELAGRLIEKYPDVYIVFTGGPGEETHAQRLVESVGSERCVSLAGRTTLRQLLVLYLLADVLVTNDSGPAQFAALTPIDVITLFGPETPAVFGAETGRNHIIWEGIVCSPCVNAYNNRLSACRNNICMQRITVDRVFELLCQVYQKRF